MSVLSSMIEKLPDSYAKDTRSNNYKLFACIAPEFEEIREMLQAVSAVMDIDNAYGAALDRLAVNVNQKRGYVNDTILRTLIKAKISADLSDGTIKTLLDFIGFIIGDEDAKTQIFELFNDVVSPESAAMTIITPLENILNSGLSMEQFVMLLERMRSGGVRIVEDIQGTFEFGSIDDYGQQYETGLADDAQTIGGTLGILYDMSGGEPLPI